MKIGVDARNLVAPLTGISRYILEMTRSLAAAGHDLTLYMPDEPHATVVPSLGNTAVAVSRAPGAINRVIWGETALPRAARRDRVEALWGPAHRLPTYLDRRIGRVLTIHDLVWVHAPDTMRRRGYIADRVLMPRAARLADRIAVPSAATAADMVRAFPATGGKTRVVHIGVTPLPAPQPGFLGQHGIDRPFILFVGMLAPRKNVFALLEAFARVPPELRGDTLLVLAGGRGWHLGDVMQRVEKLHLQDAVRLTGHVPDGGLAALYDAARFLVLPSLYEGFGIPIVEANAAGKPVLVSNNSSMPEVAGEAGLLIDPWDIRSITRGLGMLLADTELYGALAAKARANAARFDWATSAAGLGQLLSEAVEMRRRGPAMRQVAA